MRIERGGGAQESRNLFQLSKFLFGISPSEASFRKRGFECADAALQLRLERIGSVFIEGYNAALEAGHPSALGNALTHFEPFYSGFAFEGAAMGFALLDHLLPFRTRWLDFCSGVGSPHIYMLHVGAGWALARVPWLRFRSGSALRRSDAVLRWLILDGYGFHEAYFRPQRTVQRRQVPARLSAEGRHAFDQGVGRSLWFVKGGNPSAINAAIGGFSVDRQANLWSGVGLAAAYAAGASERTLEELLAFAKPYQAALAAGAAFAAKARQLAGNPAAETSLACECFGGMTDAQAAALCDEVSDELVRNECFEYQSWRSLVGKRIVRSQPHLVRGAS